MQKYKKIVDAVQWHGFQCPDGPHDLGIARCAAPCGQGWLPPQGPGPSEYQEGRGGIPSGATIMPGDYVIRDQDDRYSVCGQVWFERTYELVGD